MSLNWADWLLASTPQLKSWGVDPAERIHRTGHKRPLSAHWSRTVGMWCRHDPTDLINTAFPVQANEVQKRRARQAYDVFKYRHQLITKTDFINQHMDPPNLQAFMEVGGVMVATFAYARIRDLMGRGASAGAAAHNLYLRYDDTTANFVEDPLGILPVEGLLYYYALEHVFEETTLNFDSWVKEDSAQAWYTRAEYWRDLECDKIVALPLGALEKYAGSHEET